MFSITSIPLLQLYYRFSFKGNSLAWLYIDPALSYSRHGCIGGSYCRVVVADSSNRFILHQHFANTGPEVTVSVVRARIKVLEKKYRSLVIMTKRDVKSKSPDIDDFRDEITLLPPEIKPELQRSLTKNLSKLYSAETIDEIFGLFNLQVWNFLNYGLLQHLVDVYGEDETEETMKEYASSVEAFRKETSLKAFREAYPAGMCPTLPPDLEQKLRKVTFKHGNLSDATSLDAIENFRQELCREFSLPDLIVFLANIKKGSVTTVWFVPPAVTTILSNEMLRGNFQFLQQLCILELRIEKTIYNAGELQVYM